MSDYKTQSLDTSPEIEKLQFDHWRAMPAWEKAQQTDELIKMSFNLTLTGIRNRHPKASEEEVRRMFGELLYGKELIDQAFGKR